MTSLLTFLAVQTPLVALLALGYRRENKAAVVNTIAAIAATATPITVELVLQALGSPSVSFTPFLTLWTGLAGVLHAVGMLGYYESVGWWDHLTHTLSSALATALLYAGLLVTVGPAPDGSTGHLAAGTIAVVIGLSLFWELAEIGMRYIGERFGVEPVLVHYGWEDTGLDLVYNLLGTLFVLVVDIRLFVPVFETLVAAL